MEAVLGVRDRGGLHLIRHHVSNRTVSNYAHQCPYIGNSSTVRLYLAIELVSPTFSGACWCLDPRAFDAPLLRNQGRSAVAPPNSSQYPGIQYSAVPAH
eukprot:892427-Rhodomonas_salina.1